ncbi:RNA polymerase sigma-70 factor [Echinicola sediminis]
MKQTDNLALKNFKGKTEEDFNRLFQSFYSDLVNYAYTFLLDADEAEDLVQGFFVHFWENMEFIELTGTLQAYLFTAVKNRCLNKLKSLQVYDKHKILYIEAKMALIDEKGLEESVLWEDDLIKALENLPEQVREIIELKYLKGKKISEIATFLSLSENTVKTQLKRGRDKLKKEMNPKLFSLLFMF